MDNKLEIKDYHKEVEDIEAELKTLKEEFYKKHEELTMLSHKIDTLERKKLFSSDIAKIMPTYRGENE